MNWAQFAIAAAGVALSVGASLVVGKIFTKAPHTKEDYDRAAEERKKEIQK